MDIQNYKKYFIIDEGHWYISKVKQFSDESIHQMAVGLKIINSLLGVSSGRDQNMQEQFQKFENDAQTAMFKKKKYISTTNNAMQVFLSIHFLIEDLIDQEHLMATNRSKYDCFLEVQKDFLDGHTYTDLCNKHGYKYLDENLGIYFRNFKSWLNKFGFIYVHKNRFNLTEVGSIFSDSSREKSESNAVFLAQVKKLQIWNPTIVNKYKDYKILPYFALLQVMKELPDNQISREEYILFVTKLKNHESKSIKQVVSLITEFRALTPKMQKSYIDQINDLDKKMFPDRKRTNYMRLLDSFGKEIGAYTFGGTFKVQRGRESFYIKTSDTDRMNEELKIFSTQPGYIEIKNDNDWIMHYGAANGLSLDQIVEVYLKDGRSQEEIVKLLPKSKKQIEQEVFDKLYERDIESYYVEHIEEIEKNLVVVEKPEYGRQYPTHIGYIDLLCKNTKTDEYVVVEFKRGGASDETIGQILRYMGWVFINLSEQDKSVRGIVVGSNYSEKYDYSLLGAQSEKILNIIKFFKHPFNEENRPNA